MQKLKIYFGASIRGGRDDANLYADIIELLKQYGDVLTEHIGNQTLTVKGESLEPRIIRERDLDWLNEANVAIFEVTQPSLGVGYEIRYIEGKKPVLCLFRLSAEKSLSAMIAGSEKLEVSYYEGLDELGSLFEKFFKRVGNHT